MGRHHVRKSFGMDSYSTGLRGGNSERRTVGRNPRHPESKVRLARSYQYDHAELHRYRYFDGLSPGYGFTGIAVALLGRNHPFGVLLSAILFGALIRGGLFVDIFTEHVSKDLVLVLQAMVILFVAVAAQSRGPFSKW